MKLSNPFIISSRLAPALPIGKAVLSFDRGQFVLDFDGQEYAWTPGFPRCTVKGVNDTPESMLQCTFAAALSFLSACAESRTYARRAGRDEMTGENSNLFPANVGEWAESMSDEISMLACELETPGLIGPPV